MTYNPTNTIIVEKRRYKYVVKKVKRPEWQKKKLEKLNKAFKKDNLPGRYNANYPYSYKIIVYRDGEQIWKDNRTFATKVEADKEVRYLMKNAKHSRTRIDDYMTGWR